MSNATRNASTLDEHRGPERTCQACGRSYRRVRSSRYCSDACRQRAFIAGCSTSGCIRATAEVCFDNGFRAVVVREAVGDRSPSAHEANLFDIDARYADVVPLELALDYLVSLRSVGSPA